MQQVLIYYAWGDGGTVAIKTRFRTAKPNAKALYTGAVLKCGV